MEKIVKLSKKKINTRPKPRRICSIDASTNSLAFAIFDDVKLTHVGKIEFEGNNAYEKLVDAAKKSGSFFKLFEIDAIVIEHTIFINSPKTAADLALVQGAMLGAAGQSGVPTAGSINPIAWQTYLGNKKLSQEEKLAIMKEFPEKSTSWYKAYDRDFRKQRTIRLVNIHYNKTITDNDVADAVGVGHYAINNWDKLGT
jgi:Holliday junction resolvasome RuvABC endonuclease subunit